MDNKGNTPPDFASRTHETYEETYSVSDGARAVRKSERWYLQQLRTGRFPGHKAGRTWYLTAADITAAIEKTRLPSTGPRKPSQSTDPTRPISAKPTRRRRPIPRQNR